MVLGGGLRGGVVFIGRLGGGYRVSVEGRVVFRYGLYLVVGFDGNGGEGLVGVYV